MPLAEPATRNPLPPLSSRLVIPNILFSSDPYFLFFTTFSPSLRVYILPISSAPGPISLRSKSEARRGDATLYLRIEVTSPSAARMKKEFIEKRSILHFTFPLWWLEKSNGKRKKSSSSKRRDWIYLPRVHAEVHTFFRVLVWWKSSSNSHYGCNFDFKHEDLVKKFSEKTNSIKYGSYEKVVIFTTSVSLVRNFYDHK